MCGAGVVCSRLKSVCLFVCLFFLFFYDWPSFVLFFSYPLPPSLSLPLFLYTQNHLLLQQSVKQPETTLLPLRYPLLLGRGTSPPRITNEALKKAILRCMPADMRPPHPTPSPATDLLEPMIARRCSWVGGMRARFSELWGLWVGLVLGA